MVHKQIEPCHRTYRFACLGMSLAHSFDVKEPQDFLRGLQNALNEYDQSKEDGERPKMVRGVYLAHAKSVIDIGSQRSLFRSGRAKRQPGATDYTISYTDSLETSYLIMPHVVRTVLLPLFSSTHALQPFPLDYHQTLLSLLDILSEVYNKISKILGPSPFPSSGQHMTGPLGLLSPHPGVSYLFTGADALPTQEGDNSLWGIVNAGSNATLYAGQLGSPPPSWNSTLGDTVKQIDNRLKVRRRIPFDIACVLTAVLETYCDSVKGARRFCADGDQG